MENKSSTSQSLLSWQKDESGAALIAALALLVSLSLLVMGLVTLSQITAFTTYGNVELQRSGYIAEGALNRIMFLIEADYDQNGETDMSTFDYSDADSERYLPDSVDREIDYYGTTVRYRIRNGAGNLNAGSGNHADAMNKLTSARSSTDEDLYDAQTVLTTLIDDYVDSDDLAGEDSMEVDDYEALDWLFMPRNNAMQFREELWWIEGASAFFPPDRDGRLTLVNPFSLTGSNANPDLFQANYTLLTNYGGCEQEDALEVLRALHDWRKNRTTLSSSLEALLWANLQNTFSIHDSGVYRVTIESAASREGAPTLQLDAIFPRLGVGGDSEGLLSFYEFMRY